MARIVGVDIPRNKKIVFSLCYIHGIGISTSLNICEQAKIDKEKRVQDLSEKQISYAAQDTEFLFEIRKKLKSMLEREKRIELYEKSIKVLPILVDMEIAGYKINTFEH